MPNDEELLKEAGKKIRLPVNKEMFRIFVFGPKLSPTEEVLLPTLPASDPDGLQQHAKYLRYLTAKRLREAGWTVDFGETASIQAFWKSLGIRNLAAMEVSHGKKLCGAIVIFPTSVGAICELGLFAGSRSLAQKTLAIVHSRFKGNESFFCMGLLKLLKIKKGSFEFEDYHNAEGCIKHAVEFANDQWTQLTLDEDLIEEAATLALERRGTAFEHRT